MHKKSIITSKILVIRLKIAFFWFINIFIFKIMKKIYFI